MSECENCERLRVKIENLLNQNQSIAASNADHVGRMRELVDLADHYTGGLWPHEVNTAAGKLLEIMKRPFLRLLTKETADVIGDVWADKEYPCFICGRPTRYLDICWQGPICSIECDTWACNDAASPKVEQGPKPIYGGKS